MPTITAANSGTANDGTMYSGGPGTGANWATARDANTAAYSTVTVSWHQWATNTNYTPPGGRGGGAAFYGIFRTFFYFDTSGVTGTVSAAKIYIKGFSNGTGNAILIKSDAFGGDGGTALSTADFDAMPGWVDGSSAAGNVTAYTSESTWGSSASATWKGFAGTTALKNDIKNSNHVIVCMMNYSHDYLNSEPSHGGSSYNSNYSIYTANSSGNEPYIDYTLATGYGNSVNGVASANIGKINGIARANISKINLI